MGHRHASLALVDLDFGWWVYEGSLYPRSREANVRTAGELKGDAGTYGDELEYFVDEYNRGTEIQDGLPFGPVERGNGEEGLAE